MTVSTREILGFVALYLSSSLSSAAGVGGGAVNVAIFFIIMNYSFHYSVVYSLSTLLGNYSLQVIINWNKRHPAIKTRPMIYWDVILLLLPAQLGGADLGVILGYIFPDTLLIVFAMIVLMFTSIITFLKGYQYHKKETKTRLKEQRRRSGGDESAESTSLLRGDRGRANNGSDGSKVVLSGGNYEEESRFVSTAAPGTSAVSDHGSEANRSNSELHLEDSVASEEYDDDPYSKDPIRIPWIPVGVVVGSWMLYAIFYVLMNDMTKCTVGYFIFFACIYPILAAEIVWGYLHIKATQELQIQHTDQQNPSQGRGHNPNAPYQSLHPLSDDDSDTLGYLADALNERSKSLSFRNPEHDERDRLLATTMSVSSPSAFGTDINSIYPVVSGDILWGQSIFMPIIIVFFAFCIGITSALLGIGGGELMGPLLLRLKVLPEVSSSTVPVMSLLNTSSSIIHYMTIDDYPYEYSILMFIIGAMGGVTGRHIAIRLVKWLKRPSLLVFFLVSILMLSVILFAYELSLDPSDWSFGTFC